MKLFQTLTYISLFLCKYINYICIEKANLISQPRFHSRSFLLNADLSDHFGDALLSSVGGPILVFLVSTPLFLYPVQEARMLCDGYSLIVLNSILWSVNWSDLLGVKDDVVGFTEVLGDKIQKLGAGIVFHLLLAINWDLVGDLSDLHPRTISPLLHHISVSHYDCG